MALYCCALPFAMVDDMAWWTVPMVSLVTFTLYGIEGIGSQLEDPFGYDRNDIKMDAIVRDTKMEIDAVLSEWRKVMKVAPSPDPEPVRTTTGSTALEEGVYVPPDLFLRGSAVAS